MHTKKNLTYESRNWPPFLAQDLWKYSVCVIWLNSQWPSNPPAPHQSPCGFEVFIRVCAWVTLGLFRPGADTHSLCFTLAKGRYLKKHPSHMAWLASMWWSTSVFESVCVCVCVYAWLWGALRPLPLIVWPLLTTWAQFPSFGDIMSSTYPSAYTLSLRLISPNEIKFIFIHLMSSKISPQHQPQHCFFSTALSLLR